VKIGVGAKPHPEYNLADWVLSKLTSTEQKAIEARYDDVARALLLMMKGQLEAAQNQCNG
jgi:PTH1 family peptidyl-tRNA hydrolase